MGSLNAASVLAGRNLTGTIQAIAPGLPDVFHPGFESVTPERVDGDSGTYYKVEGNRKTAQLVAYGSASKRRTLKGVSEVPVKLASFAENVTVQASTLINLESDRGDKQRLGEQDVSRKVQECKQIMTNTRRAMLASALMLGAVYYDSDGNLLSSSSGAQVSIDYAVPSGNKNQLNVFGTGAIIAASWAVASTQIVKHIQQIKKAARKLTGYPLGCAIYGENILDYFLSNTQLKELISRNPAYNLAFSQGEIPDGFLGLNWYPGYQFFFDKAGANTTTEDITDILGVDGIVFHPEPDMSWFGWLEGTTAVPSELGMGGDDLESALANIDTVPGMYSYAKIEDDPVSATMIYGDVVLPVIKVPKAVFIADVTP